MNCQEIIKDPITGKLKKGCSKCGKVKPLDRFAATPHARSGHASWCIMCMNKVGTGKDANWRRPGNLLKKK